MLIAYLVQWNKTESKDMSYLLVDTANMFFRARHVVRADDAEERVSMAYHIMLASIAKGWRDFQGKHVIFCLEGRSWRKDVYTGYKANRATARAALTAKEAEEDKMFWEAYDEFVAFLKTKTNCTVLQHPRCEADDFIARWIQLHPNSDHVIVSSDSDFYQLIAPNVRQYNGISKQTITHEGIIDEKGKRVKDKKTKQELPAPDPQWLLFEKCMRGDTSDNIFSAFPGVRTKGSKNKVGLQEAFADRNNKGYNWNNLMLQRWVDHNGEEHRVKDCYDRNRQLIDLTCQPDDIKAVLDETVQAQVVKEATPQVGLHLLKFCGKWNLAKISNEVKTHSDYLSAGYV
jgi:5'-3' exonuclease